MIRKTWVTQRMNRFDTTPRQYRNQTCIPHGRNAHLGAVSISHMEDYLMEIWERQRRINLTPNEGWNGGQYSRVEVRVPIDKMRQNIVIIDHYIKDGCLVFYFSDSDPIPRDSILFRHFRRIS